MTEVSAFDLIGLVCPDFFERDGDPAVIEDILQEPSRRGRRQKSGERAAGSIDLPAGYSMPAGHEVGVPRAGVGRVGALLEETDDLAWNHSDVGSLHSAYFT